MRKFIFTLIVILLLSSCTSIESTYRKEAIILIDQFNGNINELTDIYNNLNNHTTVEKQITDIQSNLYEVKLQLLSMHTPNKEEYLMFQNDFLKAIEEFELLTYKLSGLATLLNSKDDYKLSGNTFTSQTKKIKSKKSVVENLISIQEEDIRRTILNCRDMLTRLKKSSAFITDIKLVFPEFILY